MFGYVTINEQELTESQTAVYRQFYCGLCRNLYQRYGRIAQMMLNYDMTFLALLLSGLYEPDSKLGSRRCLAHPLEKKEQIWNPAVEYAADMSVLLAWNKLMDDWKDEKKWIPRIAAGALQKEYIQLCRQYPRQAESMETNIRLLWEKEQEQSKNMDEVAGLTGRFLGELYVWKEDIWSEDLKNMGFYMGKFVYLMDAAADWKKDRKKGTYNLFSDETDLWSDKKRREIFDILCSMMTEVSRCFERLPVVEYAQLIRNILYSGVWCSYAKVMQKEKKENRQG